MDTPISPRPVTGVNGDGLPPYLSNGVIGLRVRDIPLQRGLAVVNGLAAMHQHALVECSPYAPYPLLADIRVDGTWASDRLYDVQLIEVVYDFSAGELHSRFRYSAGDLTADLTAITFCSRTHPSLVAHELTVEFDRPCDVSPRATLDPGDIPGRWADCRHELRIDNGESVEGAMRW